MGSRAKADGAEYIYKSVIKTVRAASGLSKSLAGESRNEHDKGAVVLRLPAGMAQQEERTSVTRPMPAARVAAGVVWAGHTGRNEKGMWSNGRTSANTIRAKVIGPIVTERPFLTPLLDARLGSIAAQISARTSRNGQQMRTRGSTRHV